MNNKLSTKKYQPIIGLEIHVELKTQSKMFCGCSASYFGKQPNTHVCPVCLGLPGALPVPNQKAIEWCMMIGLALNCEIPLSSKFDRKNYFYPDLPKGYQISQYDQPFCVNGSVVIARSETTKQSNTEIATLSSFARNDRLIRIRRVHMEEDTAKLIHEFGTQNNEAFSLIDFNRSGVPLVEIVTEPDINSAEEAKIFLQKLQQIVKYLDVSNADMEKGEMRLEPNISLLSLRGENGMNDEVISEIATLSSFARNDRLPKYKVEVKNINSFRFAQKAIDYEIQRQIEILEKGEIPIQETRGWDENKQKTVSQRIKEEAMDYRYFPEPDIPPIHWTKDQISNIKDQVCELPDEKIKRFIKDYELPYYDAEILTREKELADYFEEAVKANEKLKMKNEKSLEIKSIASWIINKKPDLEQVLPAELLKSILQAKTAVAIDEKELEQAVKKVLDENPKAVEDYKKGKENVIMFLVGQVMKKVKIKIDAQKLIKIIKDKLDIK